MKRICRTAAALTAILTLGVSGLPVHAEEETEEESSGKEETVYVITDPSGKKKEVIVSDWLKAGGRNRVEDSSDLQDITNVSGDEGFTREENGGLVWNAEGKDIYYQGTSNDDLPVEVKISYELDGQPVTAEELAGKSGHVRIRLDYENHTNAPVTVNGVTRNVCVPFVMASGMELSPEHFKNVRVTNGRIISEGSKTIVAGVAFPGLRESLEKDANLRGRLDGIDIPEYMEIEADVTDFTMGMTMTMASSDLLSDLDLDINTGELTDKINQLKDGADQLLDGVRTLKDGSGELRQGGSDLADGAGKLKDGTAKVKDGAAELKDGTAALSTGSETLQNGTAALKTGADALQEGTGALSEGTAKVNAGAGQLKAGTETAKTATAQLAAGAGQVAAGLHTLDDGMKTYVAALEGNEENPGLTAGTQAVADGAKQLDAGVNQAVAGLRQTREQLRQLENLTGDAEISMQIAVAYDNVVKAAEDMAVKKAAYDQAVSAAGQAQNNAAPAMSAEEAALYEEKIAALEEENSGLSEKNEALEAQLNELQSETPQVEESADTAALQEQIAALQAENSSLKAADDIPADNEELAALQAQVQNLQAENDSLKVEKAAADEQNAALQGQVQSLAAENESLKAELEAARNEVRVEYVEVPAEGCAAAPEEPIQQAYRQDGSHITFMDNETTTPEQAGAELMAAQQNFTTALQTYAGLVEAHPDNAFRSQVLLIGGSLDTLLDGSQETGTAGLSALQQGSAQLAAGAAALNEKAGQIVAGAKQLQGGLETVPEGGTVSLLDGADQVAGGLQQLAQGAETLDSGAAALQEGISQVSDGAEKVNAGAGQLAAGAAEVNNGAADLHEGADKLDSGAGQLKDGTAELDQGAGELADGAGRLSDGTAKLDDGVQELLDGMEKFETEGMDQLVSRLENELPDALDQIQAVLKAGEVYRNFSGTAGNDNDRVKFIFRTEEIK